MSPATLPPDPLVDEILDLFAREAQVERSLLQPDAPADSLGVTSLDVTLALFALEDHFDISLPDLMGAGSALPTVGGLVQQVLDAIHRRDAAAAAAATAPAGAAPTDAAAPTGPPAAEPAAAGAAGAAAS